MDQTIGAKHNNHIKTRRRQFDVRLGFNGYNLPASNRRKALSNFVLVGKACYQSNVGFLERAILSAL